jgi:hypothetical protein
MSSRRFRSLPTLQHRFPPIHKKMLAATAQFETDKAASNTED